MNKLTNKTIGFWGGKMLPVHMGHIHSILTAASQCDELHVVLFYNEAEEKKWVSRSKFPQDLLTPKMREIVLRAELKDYPYIKVHAINSFGCAIAAKMENISSWEAESKEVIAKIGRQPDLVFSSEPSYDDDFKHCYPKATHILVDVDRDLFPISGTEMRRDGAFKHWDYVPKMYQKYCAKSVLILGTESCVDADTEYFNGSHWVRMADYKEGDSVLQFNEDYSAELVKPNRYIKEPCENMINFHNTYNTWSQVYSEEHDLVYVTSKGNLAKKKASQVKEELYKNKFGFTGKFINWFNFNGDINIEENLLELMIAISADGSHSSKNFWRVRLIKDRKIKRLRKIIEAIGIPLDERVYEDGSHNFYIPFEFGTKIFPDYFMNLNKKTKELFIQKIFLWDGCEKDRRYFTTEKRNADIVQFIFNSLGIKTLFHTDKRENRATCFSVEQSSTKYTTLDCKPDTDRTRLVEKYKTIDGYKYCFNVPSHMLVLRRSNHVFITGNCGKSTLVKKLAQVFNTSYVHEIGRDICDEYGTGQPPIEVYTDILYTHKVAEKKAREDANKVFFVDTEAVVTNYYAGLYENTYLNVAHEMAKLQKYDLVIYLEPSVAWVDDGMRIHGSEDIRKKNNEHLKAMLDVYLTKDQIVFLDGDYLNRYKTAIELVKEIL